MCNNCAGCVLVLHSVRAFTMSDPDGAVDDVAGRLPCGVGVMTSLVSSGRNVAAVAVDCGETSKPFSPCGEWLASSSFSFCNCKARPMFMFGEFGGMSVLAPLVEPV